MFFKKYVPLGASKPFIQIFSSWSEVFIGTDSLPTIITNSFMILVVQKSENIFHMYFASFFVFALEFILSLEASTTFTMTKISETKVLSFHANADIKVMFTVFKKCIRKKQKHCP